jgi:hypothetical protein
MAREFKPVRFFVLMGLTAFLVCGVTAFYTQRAAHGRTSEERAAYSIGYQTGEDAPADAISPSDAELNMTAQKYFKSQGSGNQQNWDLAFENGYTDGFKKRHPRP